MNFGDGLRVVKDIELETNLIVDAYQVDRLAARSRQPRGYLLAVINRGNSAVHSTSESVNKDVAQGIERYPGIPVPNRATRRGRREVIDEFVPGLGETAMHEEYRDEKIKELRDQLTRFAPKAKKVEQAALAEKLYSEIEPDRTYAFDYLCFRVTNYRPETPSRHSLAASDLKHDLRLLIEDLSDSADIAITEVPEPVHTVDELSKMFNVSTKTISRWRTSGLVSRRLLFGGRKRVGFLHSSVERFVNDNRDKIRRGERFSQLTDDEKSEMIERARQLVEGGASLSDVTRQLASQMNRSPETIRYTLKNFDAENPSLAIFPNHRGVLNEDDKRAIFRQYSHGSTVAQLCKRFQRTRTSIQRILLDMRMQEIGELPLDYIYNEDFEDTRHAKKSIWGRCTGARQRSAQGSGALRTAELLGRALRRSRC